MIRITLFHLLLCVMFIAPFVVLAVNYTALPSELLVLRFGTLWASKSIFWVFRIPLMNLISGLCAAVMLSLAPAFEKTERRKAYSRFFSTILFTAALKSNFEALELSALAASSHLKPYSGWLGICTFMTVGAGVSLAMWLGRKASLPWLELRMTIQHKLALVGLFALYVLFVTFSLLASHHR